MGGARRRNSGASSSSSSSGEEDGDADWRAAIDSVAVASSTGRDRAASTSNGSTTESLGRRETKHDGVGNRKPQNIKHYQIKAQKLLDGILEETIEIVGADHIHILDEDSRNSEGRVRLFKNAPPGIVFDHIDEESITVPVSFGSFASILYELQRPTKKPRILPGKEIDEKSKKFRWQLQSIAVEGMDIIAAARDSQQKTLAKKEAKDAAAKAAAKREEERVAELRKVRGERWLPSIARDRRVNSRVVVMRSFIVHFLNRINSVLRATFVFHICIVPFFSQLPPHFQGIKSASCDSLSSETEVREMAVFLAAVVDGLGQCMMVLWERQERRFDTVLDAVSVAGRALMVALAFCFLSVHHLYSRGQLPVPFL
ncbi:hypothetical protein RHSIM_Rhsim10G0099700 [Rhododendron simsii]|uniref:Uncharacterized protein n=1 Tax=Rhododendron simsii TaxID=118357 RepID=A0A834LBL5_RHOSS|nr:hypothetical protein RHSIM_Rhsim10G0099700 [Rhododendron simsii]